MIVVTADWVMVAEDAVGRQDNVSVAMVGDEAPYSELELFFFWYRQFHAQLDATLWKIQEGGRPPFWKCIIFHFFIVCKRSTDHDDICTTTSNATQNQIINDSFIFLENSRCQTVAILKTINGVRYLLQNCEGSSLKSIFLLVPAVSRLRGGCSLHHRHRRRRLSSFSGYPILYPNRYEYSAHLYRSAADRTGLGAARRVTWPVICDHAPCFV